MTDYERTILNHYNLTTLYPNEWPAEKDESDDSDEDLPIRSRADIPVRRSKSRYSALERNGSERRSLVPGAEKTGSGAGNLVPKDEPDPLGSMDSVVHILRQRGLPVEDDTRLRGYRLAEGMVRMKLITDRKSLSALLHYLLASSIPIPGPFRSFYPITSPRPGIPLPLD